MHRLDTISFLATASIAYAGSLFKYSMLLPLIFFTLFFCITMLLTGKYIIAIIDVKCVNNCTKKFRPQMYIRVVAEPQDIMLLSQPSLVGMFGGIGVYQPPRSIIPKPALDYSSTQNKNFAPCNY